jgi:tetratricopeptide (TPR) repeat protein
VPADVADELRDVVGAARSERIEHKLAAASEAFRRGRFEEARRLLRPLAELAPRSPSIRELHGLSLYHLGRWKAAVTELEAVASLTGDVGVHPALADAHRALGRFGRVQEPWDELKAASPDPDLVAEGRIVAAGALADQGRLPDAIRLLEAAPRPSGRAKARHLRTAYALADLYERAGDLPRAREMFARVVASDPDLADAAERLRALA